MKSITIQSIKGMEEVGLVKAFAINEINRKFAILTRKESLGDSMSKVYISEVLETPEGIKLVGITDESLWDKVKSSMKDIVQGNSNTLTVFVLNGKIVEEGFRIIGLKDADVEKLSTSESSFVMNKEEKQPEQVVSTPNNSTIPNEAVVAPVPEPKPVPEETPQVSETNIFDMPEPIVTPQPLNANGTEFSNTNLFFN